MLKGLFVTILVFMVPGYAFAKEPVPHHVCITESKCDAYVGKGLNDDVVLNSASKSCASMHGKWLTNTTCPSKRRNGLCKFGEGTPGEMWSAMYGEPLPPATEANYINQCKALGEGNWYK